MADILQIKARQLLLRFAPGLPLLALMIVLATQLAHWTWTFITPNRDTPSPSVVQTDAAAAARMIISEHLFGYADQTANPASSDASLNIRLSGVFATRGRSASYAIVNTGAKTDQTVRVGDEIQPGVTLQAVHPASITVNHAGLTKRISLVQKDPEQLLTQATPATLGIRSLGYNAYSVSRNNLTTVLQNGNANIRLGQLTSASGGGMLVTDAPTGSLTKELGLQTGDLLRNINGQAVSSTADLASIYQRFKQASQVQLDITRAGKLIQLRYTVQQ